MSTLYYDRFDSPIGPLTIAADALGLRHVLFAEHCRPAAGQALWQHAPDAPVLAEPRRQLLQYLQGQRQDFQLRLAAVGTPFQQAVWAALARIPFGQTWSYRQLATHIGRPTATRAVGAANSRNPLPIILPCHRVIGSNGQLTGFAGGLAVKQALLALEAQARDY
ncbi:MAG: methylated-DNA--[protein]-cysteine S-methyltransferase [Stenotrophomonas sp.]